MAQTYESGHAKNVANMVDLLSFIDGYGTSYDPVRDALKRQSMDVLCKSAKDAISAVNAALPVYSKAVAAREAAFVPINQLVTRVMNFLKSIASTDHIYENALTFARKIQGRRAVAKRSEEQIKADVAAGKEVTEKSSSQMSYDNRLDNLDKFIQLLINIKEYAPNESDLKVGALSVRYADLVNKNLAVISAATPLSNARIARDTILYKDDTGLVDIALDAKAYIKAAFGASSPQFKQVSKLSFRKVRN
jgi:hypothetical protein